MTDGLLVVDKPAGWTSHDVVAKLPWRLRAAPDRPRRHARPDATGVLLVGLGRVTRLLRFLQETSKEYRGVVSFGVATDSLDAAGAVLERKAMPVGKDEVRRAMERFVGDIAQVPPMVSALKVGGRRLHQLAREGKEVEREPRPVHIERFELEDFEPGPYPRATVLVECSSGTYIRSLAADLGAALGGAAHLAELRRLRVGSFTVEEAHPLDGDRGRRRRAHAVARGRDARPAERDGQRRDGTRGRARLRLPGRRARAHRRERRHRSGDADGADPFAIVDEQGDLLAVYERRGAGLKPAVVVRAADGGGRRERTAHRRASTTRRPARSPVAAS